ncbi:helix-turn-helix domain-containing protein [Claveliimonas bilis]|uniref:HTH cro/C1-type domain-containing protein n=1 Tax=Claveliimonas bilis TaxID=3028070 RepID=A0ABN6Z321_9FIRM|nr:helix-turn-helix transcriptional regulator [Claveliimonas bilis]BDZ76937.1 hypothetical protein Lac1_11200 [Claveliimonas bilis]
MTFGEKLKIARTEAGLKQTELARQLNTTGNTISNWENNVSKPDLDTLSYICGILHVNASFFLQPTLPEDEVSITELKIIKKYRDLDAHGREMVDFTLEKEYERSKALEEQNGNNIVNMPSHLEVNAAHHTRGDFTNEERQEDEDMLD